MNEESRAPRSPVPRPPRCPPAGVRPVSVPTIDTVGCASVHPFGNGKPQKRAGPATRERRQTGGWFRSLLALDVAGMPRTMRMEYPGAIYHVMDRGDRRESGSRLAGKEF